MSEPCARVPYTTSAEAKTALAKVRARRGATRRSERKGSERGTYKCRRCGFWHLTSMSK